jgi:hypothetical protein
VFAEGNFGSVDQSCQPGGPTGVGLCPYSLCQESHRRALAGDKGRVEYEAALRGDALHVIHSEVFAQQGYCEETDDY